MSGCLKFKKEANKNNSSIKVIAHRADWRNAPENSLQGAMRCINLGVDMIEIDLAMTKDSVLVLMHDKTLERTTNGSGFIKDWTLDSLSHLKLKQFNGKISIEKIPTFKELMLEVKGKVDVFVDKGYEYIPQAYKILEETNTLNQAHFLGFVSSNQLIKDYPLLHKKINYIPLVLPLDTITTFMASFDKSKINIDYYLFSFDHENKTHLELAKATSNKAFSIATTQSQNYCAGHTDSLSLINPKQGWGWIIDQGFNAICTDYPEELIQYLEYKNLRK